LVKTRIQHILPTQKFSAKMFKIGGWGQICGVPVRRVLSFVLLMQQFGNILLR
jgi:hypothetical protein